MRARYLCTTKQTELQTFNSLKLQLFTFMFSVDSNETHTSFMPHLPAYVLVQEMKEIVVFDRDQFHTRYPGSFSNGESHTFDHLLQRKDLEEGGGRGRGWRTKG